MASNQPLLAGRDVMTLSVSPFLSVMHAHPVTQSQRGSLDIVSWHAEQVLVVSCGLLDTGDLIWWQPYTAPLPSRQTTSWLPPAIEVFTNWQALEV
jgi:hypothetical protein